MTRRRFLPASGPWFGLTRGPNSGEKANCRVLSVKLVGVRLRLPFAILTRRTNQGTLVQRLLLLSGLFMSTASAATLSVAVDGSGSYSTLQEALAVASDGDLIEVGSNRFKFVTE